MQIRKHYIESFNKIKSKHGLVIPNTYIVHSDDPLPKVVGYTSKFIVDDGEEHYRYDYYRDILGRALTHYGINQAKNKIIHLDLGCGPGLFSWVVQDYLVSKHAVDPGDIDIIGYDHAKNMIKLANLFRKHLPVEFNFEGYSGLNKIQNILKTRDFSDCDCIITFGYVLIQLHGAMEAMHNFAKIIKRLFPVNSCILVAVDAFSGNRPQCFRNACDELFAALSDTDIYIENRYIRGPDRSWMRARLNQEISNGKRRSNKSQV